MTRRSSCENCEQETWEEPTPRLDNIVVSLFVDILVEFHKYWVSDNNIQITTLVVWWGTLPAPRLDQTPVRQQFHILEEEQHNLSWYRGGQNTCEDGLGQTLMRWYAIVPRKEERRVAGKPAALDATHNHFTSSTGLPLDLHFSASCTSFPIILPSTQTLVQAVLIQVFLLFSFAHT